MDKQREEVIVTNWALRVRMSNIAKMVKTFKDTRVVVDIRQGHLLLEDDNVDCLLYDGYEVLSVFTKKAPTVLVGVNFEVSLLLNNEQLIRAYYMTSQSDKKTRLCVEVSTTDEDLLTKFREDFLRKPKFDYIDKRV